MSDIIHLLPDSVANQIAAGEVIQRPSSVVKELVENAIDAGATEIQVILTDAGKTCIQVIDNGKGMTETDARLSFERHATSKIQTVEDLYNLHTMGFRGEALASIVAVAQVELRTRVKEEEVGVALTIESSRITGQEPIGCQVGANFIVRNLFYNVPARRKFLKSNHTELSNSLQEFERIALAHPEVAFTFKHNGQVIQQLPSANFRQRIIGIFGKKLDTQLIPTNTDTSLVNVHGYVGTPDNAKKKGAQQYFFVNGRYMRHPYFAKAIQAAYERLIPDGEQISFFLNLEVDPKDIDVNVHPTKTEIKFSEEQSIWQILLAATREALGKNNAIPSIDFDTINRPEIPVFTPNGDNSTSQTPNISYDTNYNPFTQSPSRPTPTIGGFKAVANYPFKTKPSEAQNAALFDLFEQEKTQRWEYNDGIKLQFLGRYILTPQTSGIMVIDQNRASERILYDKYRVMMDNGKCATQGLLFPQIVQLPASLATILEQIEEEITAIGFNISNLGGGSYSIMGVPVSTEGLDPCNLLESLLDNAVNKALSVKEDIHHIIAVAMARKAAIPVGEYLTPEDMNNICKELFECESPNFSPEGKLIISIIPQNSIERLFD